MTIMELMDAIAAKDKEIARLNMVDRPANRLYIAAQYPKRDELRGYAAQLRARGIIVTSRWLEETMPLTVTLGDCKGDFNRDVASSDLDDIDAADGILFFSEDSLIGIPRGGRHVEFGYALGQGKRMFVVGSRENVFHFLPRVSLFGSFDEFVAQGSWAEVKG